MVLWMVVDEAEDIRHGLTFEQNKILRVDPRLIAHDEIPAYLCAWDYSAIKVDQTSTKTHAFTIPIQHRSLHANRLHNANESLRVPIENQLGTFP